jgi:hypothetical protein
VQETFRLRREVSAAALDVWHLKGIIVRALTDGKSRLRGIDLKERSIRRPPRRNGVAPRDDQSDQGRSRVADSSTHQPEAVHMNGFLKLFAVLVS